MVLKMVNFFFLLISATKGKGKNDLLVCSEELSRE